MNLMHSVSLVSYYPPPKEPLCRLTCVGTLSFRVRELPGLSASNVLAGIAGNIGDREELAREYPNSPPLPPFPFSLVLFPSCLVRSAKLEKKVPTHIGRQPVACVGS